MEELVKTNDLVLISFISHLLEEAGIDFAVFDTYTSAVEGSIGAIPRRIMVKKGDFPAAKRLLSNASITMTS